MYFSLAEWYSLRGGGCVPLDQAIWRRLLAMTIRRNQPPLLPALPVSAAYTLCHQGHEASRNQLEDVMGQKRVRVYVPPRTPAARS